MSDAKQAAGFQAAELVKNGMVVGLGTGTTAFFFIEKLAERCRNGLNITAVASSIRSHDQAEKAGIPLEEIDSLATIDLMIDGADEIDLQKRMIKGGGGALLREKILASMSEKMIVIVDDSKLVEHLGRFPLPVEIVPFAYRTTLSRLERAGYYGKLRESFLTDNGNLVIDIPLDFPCDSPQRHHEKIKSITGVIETGFFVDLADQVLIGHSDGTTEWR